MCFSHLGVFLILVKPLTTENTEHKTTPKICKITVSSAGGGHTWSYSWMLFTLWIKDLKCILHRGQFCFTNAHCIMHWKQKRSSLEWRTTHFFNQWNKVKHRQMKLSRFVRSWKAQERQNSLPVFRKVVYYDNRTTLSSHFEDVLQKTEYDHASKNVLTSLKNDLQKHSSEQNKPVLTKTCLIRKYSSKIRTPSLVSKNHVFRNVGQVQCTFILQEVD